MLQDIYMQYIHTVQYSDSVYLIFGGDQDGQDEERGRQRDIRVIVQISGSQLVESLDPHSFFFYYNEVMA